MIETCRLTNNFKFCAVKKNYKYVDIVNRSGPNIHPWGIPAIMPYHRIKLLLVGCL